MDGLKFDSIINTFIPLFIIISNENLTQHIKKFSTTGHGRDTQVLILR